MVKQTSKANIKKISFFAILLTLLLGSVNLAFAEEDATDFNVKVKEVLSVAISTPTEWATGDVDTFLRNKVSINVTSNNAAGFTASMTAKTEETALKNTFKNTFVLPTLTANTTRANFPANFWGYSLDDTEAGSGTSTYGAMVASNGTPITILSSQIATSGSKDFYFGAKANATLASGTYTGTVVISVVSGVIDNTNPITPTNPVTPNPTPNSPTYNPTTNITAYTYNRVNSGSNSEPETLTTTTEVSSGDNRNAYDSYVPPQGVMRSTTSKVQGLTELATGLAVASAVGTASSVFFLFAKRREEDEDDEDQM